MAGSMDREWERNEQGKKGDGVIEREWGRGREREREGGREGEGRTDGGREHSPSPEC